MKKLFVTIGLAATVFAAQAQNFVARDFLGGNRSVFLTNNTTASYGDSGIPMTNGNGQACYSLTNRYSTNSLTSPGTLYTNQAAYFGPAWVDVVSFSDRNGNDASASIVVSLVGTTASTTGVMTFTFAQELEKDTITGLGVPASHAQNKFIFAVTPTGTTTLSLATNVPTAQMQGTAGWRLLSVAEPNNAAAGGVMITSLALNGFIP